MANAFKTALASGQRAIGGFVLLNFKAAAVLIRSERWLRFAIFSAAAAIGVTSSFGFVLPIFDAAGTFVRSEPWLRSAIFSSMASAIAPPVGFVLVVV